MGVAAVGRDVERYVQAADRPVELTFTFWGSAFERAAPAPFIGPGSPQRRSCSQQHDCGHGNGPRGAGRLARAELCRWATARRTSRGSRMRKPTAGKVAALLLSAVVIAGCPGTTHTVRVGYLYEPEETGISHVTAYGATVAVSLGAPGLISVEGCGLFSYVRTVKENQTTHHHNLPASYCLTVGL